MTYQKTVSDAALNRLRAAAGVVGIIESGLASERLTRENALRMLAFCNSVVIQTATQKEEERLLATLRQGLTRISLALSQHDPLGLRDELP